MEYRVLTVEREFGSGGSRIAKTIADLLGWKLLDSVLIDAIARAAHVNPKIVSRYDERAESWLSRMNRTAMRSAAMTAGVMPEDGNSFDPDVMTKITRHIIEQAHADGNCVIVGRGAQCILQCGPDVFHVFVYAPIGDRLRRLRERHEPDATKAHIVEVDEKRAEYLRHRFGKVWNDPHLYDLMISTRRDEVPIAQVIVNAMQETRERQDPHTGKVAAAG